MALRAGDDKVCRRLLRPADLGADTGIARLQGAVPNARPIGTDCGVELVAAPRIDRVVDGVDPFGIGTEAGRAAHIERQMHAEPGMLRNRINEALERRPTSEREIDAAAV